MLTLSEIFNTLGNVHSGIPTGHGIYIGNNGVWSASQSVVVFFPYNVEKSCSLDMKNTKSTLSVMKEPKFEWEDAELTIKSGRVRVKLPYIPTEENKFSIYKRLAKFKKTDKWIELPDAFQTAISLCAKSVSDNAMHGTLTCFNIADKYVIASNNITVTRYNLNKTFINAMLNKPALLSALAINPTHYHVTESALIMKNNEGVMIQIPVVRGSYPDFSDILKTTPDHSITVDHEQLSHIAELTERLFDGGNILDNSIILEARDRKLIVTNSSQAGNVKAIMAIDFDGTFKFTIDSATLRLLTNTSATIGVTQNAVVVETEEMKLVAAVGGA